MGINFLYIGRDAVTLKDKLPIDPRVDQLPVEMNLTSVFSKIGSYIPGSSSSPASTEIEWVDAPPYNPKKRPTYVLDLSTIIPGFPKMTELYKAAGKADELLSIFLPGLLPKDFKLSKVFVPGGVIVSEMDVLRQALSKKKWPKPNGTGIWGLGRADDFAASRTALRLVMENEV
jgi:hypothetical protein